MDVAERARVHAALGDRYRLQMVEQLLEGDRTFQSLAESAGLPGNAAAHHLGVLEAAGLIERRVSEGDHRRRYITLRQDRLDAIIPRPVTPAGRLLFVCTHNSARSQFAAALWEQRTGSRADSAGTSPASRVHPSAIRVAREYGLDLGGAQPKGYEEVRSNPDLIVSVCDRAHEAGWPFPGPAVHWSVPDPVPAGSIDAFRSAFADLAARIGRIAPPA